MTKEHFDDETLMAFADGELDEATSLRLETALEIDDALAERLAVFLDTRTALASAIKPLIDEPVPDALAASVRRMVEDAEANNADIEGAKVIAFRGREKPEISRLRQRWLMPVAASVLAIITGLGGFVAGRSGLETGASVNDVLSAALDHQPSGGDITVGQSEVLRIVSSFVDGRGTFCREYELKRQEENTLAVACRSDGAWVTRLALSSPRADGYVPASSQETIDTYLTSIEAGGPLSATEEQRLLSKAE
ncbi:MULTISPECIES: anti-sigma factor family protein [Rhizobium/Agrobacterium group]|uniref:anti-sigma factor family protein n=1 Tax=Rhizobium/Agrobacterium group TaxID=227290 RepID=UPI00230148AA|nr:MULTISPECIES: hypothetical protein [Rhizobium/Agrobacterium group]MDA5635033.1 hypothetical protein [Agrobacterium sp. ST15.16.024]MDF1890181.1 hypothetical protein [Rhizobium rhizogenes]